ncbi:PadR family transcriptional regulator [Dietzia sp. ANT_WB102]|uniref:PadR family transcriptional regulator n=1 Tax=Dietzia sp. ANT_WB102 TaxID=2597345 RepID=UPI0011EDBEC2|nr:PadR family transcriptional regulator [Dietzia sp. ANT_WB102]KAA0918028.1 PadR family transcriptional regulator [Dietzia sp. ANT_WB102]
MSENSDPPAEIELPALPATAWAVLGTLSFGEELSGYDIKTWADWSLNYFYWSPSFSQVYSELKRLESHGFVVSRSIPGETRKRRAYSITPEGLDALRGWTRTAEVDRPALKHSTILHLWLGHLNDPENLKARVREHISQMTELRDGAATRATNAGNEPSWAYAQMVMDWSRRHYQAEITMAEELLDQIDDAAAKFIGATMQQGTGLPAPVDPGKWKRAGREA